ncbi:ABC transporter permease [Natrononativus amylolyticus]|uniref:ABC transporter permease n=1 Tax=Natrononativus amylolyticus TaxID=2963434 RepID=UPI0020CF60E2|nr:FtsX-like permease family protein [Natrononativus amylolyticus]
MGGSDGNRRTRWVGLVRLSIARVRAQASRYTPGLTVPTIVIVALTVSNLVLVTGVALALADTDPTADDADVRIVASGGDAQSSVAGAEGVRLGAAHDRTAPIADREGVTHATPALSEPVLVTAPESDRAEYVTVVGVVPGPEATTVSGLSTEHLEPGDPHYADGAYDGPRAGEIVLSTAAADALGVDDGETVALESAADGTTQSHEVTAVEPAAEDEAVALVHLSELQALTGADGEDLADRILVWGDEDAAQAAGEEAYPNATVETDGVALESLFADDLALVTSVLALLTGIVLCSLFVATTVGLSVDSDRRALAVLAALGFSSRSRLAIVAVATVTTALVGALLGTALGFAGIVVVNAVATATFAPGAVAVSDPVLVPYALVVTVVSVLVALPYPLAIAARTDVLAEVER